MLDMAKLSKEKRERIERLLKADLCICCESKQPRARGRCQTCLNLIYLPKRHGGDPVKVLKEEQKALRAGTLLPLYDKTFSALKALVRKIRKGSQSATGPLQEAS